MSKQPSLSEMSPESFVRETLALFIEESAENRRVDGGRYFDAPLVGFSSADDPLFTKYKEIIGEFHLTPCEIFELTHGKCAEGVRLSVISWVVPISADTREANRKQDKFPAMLWSHTRFFGEPFNEKLRDHLVDQLTNAGYRAVAPARSPHFVHHMHGPRVGFTSNFSERHTAYACGLGTFGHCDGLITPKGKAIRLGSVVTDLVLTPSRRPYPNHHANCLYFFNGSCRACESRCPGGAITREGKDKDKCYDFMHNVSAPAKGAEYGVRITGCGLCQTRVPCEFEIPKLIQKHYKGEKEAKG